VAEKKTLELIVCPKCKGKLSKNGEKLICHVCKLRFRIIDGIPDMILDHAEKN
jgi:uncharacterized protein YbaR (Trm112 family)